MDNVVIRPAVYEDFDFVSGLMNEALVPYYGGDHTAHAKRIFENHIIGGQDAVGHFSAEQKMFIATYNNVPVGLLHLVNKKQGTIKISPLIISKDYQGKLGIGSRLIEFAEDFAKENSARQIYCTVAQQNRQALSFFLKKGYTIAGESEGHYKAGIVEHMLYKLFIDSVEQDKIDRPHISVVPVKK